MKNIFKSYNIFTIVFAVFVLLTVIWTPVFGLGDLSEYTATFESVGLYNAGADTYAIAQNYGIAEPDGSTKSVFQLFLMLMIGLNKLLFSKTVFNIHFISVVYSAMFLIGIYFLQKNMNFEKDYLNYAFSALLAIIFLDLGYLAYFNSFYTEALIFVLIIALAALAVSIAGKFSYIKLILFAICACLLSAMRFSAAVVALASAAVLAVIAFTAKGKGRAVSIVLGAVVAVVSVTSMINAQIPARDVKLYNLIYNDFAAESDTAIAEFGLEGKEIGENPTMVEMSAAVEGITYGDVVKFYAANPDRFGANMKSAANNAYFLIQDFASYRESGAYYGLREGTNLKIWNFLKRRVLPQGIWVILAFIVIYAVMAIREFIKYNRDGKSTKAYLALFAVLMPVGALSEMIGTVITTGKILISKNMFVFGIYFDLMIITAVFWVAATLIARQEDIKTKYGVNQ